MTTSAETLTLKSHLPNCGYQAIHTQFGNDLHDLMSNEGVNYEYQLNDEGLNDGNQRKIWNIKIGFEHDKSNLISVVFVCVHSNQTTIGHKFFGFTDDTISFYRIVALDTAAITGWFPEISKDTSFYPFEFASILNEGERKDNVSNPTVTKSLQDRCTKFFANCPSLLPPCSDLAPPPPLRPPQPLRPPPQNNDNSSLTKIIKFVIIFALLFFSYKIIQKTYHYYSNRV